MIRIVLAKAVADPALVDEFYCQVVKQLVGNLNHESVLRGWEILIVLALVFAPSKDLQPHVVAFFETSQQDSNVSIQQIARNCQNHIQSAVERGQPIEPLPSDEDLQFLINSSGKLSSFGATLKEIVADQQKTFPGLDVPWIFSRLLDNIRASNGQSQQGLFRIKAKADEVFSLRNSYERNPQFAFDPKLSPHVPATLLKEWLRELREPVIPKTEYYRFVEASEDIDALYALVQQLPDVHQNVLYKFLSFVQFVGIHDDNLMDNRSLSLMLSPALFRCPETDLSIVAKYTSKESKVIETLLDELAIFV